MSFYLRMRKQIDMVSNLQIQLPKDLESPMEVTSKNYCKVINTAIINTLWII